ncbi:MAG: hypothetical protein K6F99_07995 [Lachnospiraceae bacterium]|nr:hypothetical protein [Lachnospiraceae bacterium]
MSVDNTDNKTAGESFFRQFFNNKNKVNLLCIPLLIYIVYFLAELIMHTVSDANIPNEYREAANVLLTRKFLSGENPYSLSALGGELPPYIYLYGPVYSLVTAFLSFIFPIDIIVMHYIVTFICVVVSGVLAAAYVWRHSRSQLAALGAFLFLLICHWRYGFINAVPDSMALMLMILMLYILTETDFKYKPQVLALLTIIIFFTKQYFVLIAGTVVIYLFIYERKNLLKYILSGLVMGIIIFAVISLTCPLFWTYTIYLAKGPGSGVAGHVTKNGQKVTSLSYNMQQIMSIGGMFLFFFVAETVGVVISAIKRKFDRADVLMFIHLFVSGVCLVGYLGKNGGAWLSYYLELFVPALIIGALLMMVRHLPDKGGAVWVAVSFAAFILVFGFTIMRVEQRLPKSPMTDEDYLSWSAAKDIMEENASGEEYLYPLLAYYGIEMDQYIYNSGQPFVVSEKFYKKYHESALAMKYFPYAENIFASHLNYRKTILEKVRNGEYSLVTYLPDYDADKVFETGDLTHFYTLKDTLSLRTGREIWKVEFWTKK